MGNGGFACWRRFCHCAKHVEGARPLQPVGAEGGTQLRQLPRGAPPLAQATILLPIRAFGRVHHTALAHRHRRELLLGVSIITDCKQAKW